MRWASTPTCLARVRRHSARAATRSTGRRLGRARRHACANAGFAASARRAPRRYSARATASARLMVVGEAPGAEEDRQGEPFVGRAGMLLNSMLRAAGFERGDVFIANVLKCRPPHNRDPSAEEAERCLPYLRRQIEFVAPAVILCVGRIAAQRLSAPRLSARRACAAECTTLDGVPVIVTYHPAYLLRSPGEKRKSWEDLKLALGVLADGTAREELTPPRPGACAPWRQARPAHRVAALERESYVFPWNDQIFADCLRVGYHCVASSTRRGRLGLRRALDGRRRGARAQHLHQRAFRRRGIGRRLLSRCSRMRATAACATPFWRCAAPIARDRALPVARLRVGRHAARLLPGAGRAARTHWSTGSSLARCRRSIRYNRAPSRCHDDSPNDEIARRRSFAIISHPDAGKTTLTEKLLLFGGAIQMAGTVKGRKAARHATSDWMRLEQQRGISVTSSVMQFPYHGRVVNLLDTPGPRGLLRGHLPHADRGRFRAHGHRLREGRRGAHDQADGSLPAARHADHDLHQQARPRRTRADRAARRNRACAADQLRAGYLADRHGPRAVAASITCCEDHIYVYDGGRSGRVGTNRAIEGLASDDGRARSSATVPRLSATRSSSIRGAMPAFDRRRLPRRPPDAGASSARRSRISASRNCCVAFVDSCAAAAAARRRPRAWSSRTKPALDRLRVQDPGQHGSRATATASRSCASARVATVAACGFITCGSARKSASRMR